MRSMLPATLLTLVALFLAAIMVALQNGAEMRGLERRAAANAEDIMLAQEQFRLAFQTRVIGPCHIMVAPPRTETGHQI